jgi:hypothetical protein
VFLPNYAETTQNITMLRIKEYKVEASGFHLQLVEGDFNPLYRATELATETLMFELKSNK